VCRHGQNSLPGSGKNWKSLKNWFWGDLTIAQRQVGHSLQPYIGFVLLFSFGDFYEENMFFLPAKISE
jgi:hypothetical protein